MKSESRGFKFSTDSIEQRPATRFEIVTVLLAPTVHIGGTLLFALLGAAAPCEVVKNPFARAVAAVFGALLGAGAGFAFWSHAYTVAHFLVANRGDKRIELTHHYVDTQYVRVRDMKITIG